MDMDQPWLSVLIPVYKVEPYLEACMASVFDPPVEGVEVLLLDDASPDGSGALARTLAQRWPGVRVLAHERNRGLAAARNTLLAAAAGRYVWFLDSDDLLAPGAVRALARVVEQEAPDLVLCDFAYLREHTRLKHRLRGERHRRTFPGRGGGASNDRAALLAGLLSCAQLHAWSKIARREVWRNAPFPEGRYFEDIPTISGLVAAAGRFVHVAEPWVRYRQRAGSILSAYTPEKVRHLLLGLSDLYGGVRVLPEYADPRARFALDYFCLRSLASAARRTASLESQARAGLVPQFSEVLTDLFPAGVGAVLSGWARRGWWLRALRIRLRLTRMGLLQ